MRRLYRIEFDDVRDLPHSVLLRYCVKRNVGLLIEVNKELAIVYTRDYIAIYRGREKIDKLEKYIRGTLTVDDLLGV